ncbi:MAG: transketolase, partial [Gammaproteobacteria bacterium]|nr:transketolase [Gammaproteobacteria bacterium]
MTTEPYARPVEQDIPRRTLANAIRALSMDAVQQAASGHPGAPMGMADIAEVLWNDVLVHNPANPTWFNRDRFVLSNGHGSMLMYSLLHLSGYAVSLEDIKRFRQMGSNTAGHPEYGLTPGVETTTGPLGQGLANAVGMALAERTLAARFNRDDLPLVDHYTYVAIGDGCLMEGISHEACSLAGTLSLGKLVALYDDNGISIDGRIDGWFRDDTPARFAAYDWHVVPDVDGHDAAAIAAALAAARAEPDRPSLICCKTVIGKGAPTKAGTAASHGAPLGEDEIAGARAALDWPHGAFEIPADIYAAWDAREAGAAAENDWQALLERYRIAYPAQAAEFERCIAGRLPDGWRERTDELIAAVEADGPRVATRKASEMALDAFGPLLPELIGGSADLTGSNNTRWSGAHAIDPDDADSRGGNYVYFGVR